MSLRPCILTASEAAYVEAAEAMASAFLHVGAPPSPQGTAQRNPAMKRRQARTEAKKQSRLEYERPKNRMRGTPAEAEPGDPVGQTPLKTPPPAPSEFDRLESRFFSGFLTCKEHNFSRKVRL